LKGEGRRREGMKIQWRGELVQCTQCACMELSQANPLSWLMGNHLEIKLQTKKLEPSSTIGEKGKHNSHCGKQCGTSSKD
jgi:hypothetical protein